MSDIRNLSTQLGATTSPVSPVTVDVSAAQVGNAPQPMPPPPMPPLRQPPPPAPSPSTAIPQPSRVPAATIQPPQGNQENASMQWVRRAAYLMITLWLTSTLAFLPSLWFPLNHALAMPGFGALALTIWLVTQDGAKHPTYLAAILTALSGYIVFYFSPLVK